MSAHSITNGMRLHSSFMSFVWNHSKYFCTRCSVCQSCHMLSKTSKKKIIFFSADTLWPETVVNRKLKKFADDCPENPVNFSFEKVKRAKHFCLFFFLSFSLSLHFLVSEKGATKEKIGFSLGIWRKKKHFLGFCPNFNLSLFFVHLITQ